MVNFEGIKQKIVDIDYGWKNPRSLIVLVPGLSLIAQKIKISDLFKTLTGYQSIQDLPALLVSREYAQLNAVYRWHALGSLVQTVVFLASVTLNPLFLLPAAISMYELSCSLRGISHEMIHYKGNNFRFER